MTDRETVIKGLECCSAPGRNCDMRCPYYDEDECEARLERDALILLKEQEAKWVYGEDETGVDGWYCSKCNFFEPWFYDFDDDIDFIKRYEHCPKCGRSMTSFTGNIVHGIDGKTCKTH